MRQEWGPDYRTNINSVMTGFLGRFDEDLRANWEGATLADGTPIFSHAPSLRALVGLTREINPAGVTVPGGVENQLKSVADELAENRAIRLRSMAEWNSPANAARRARELELIDAESSLRKRVG